MTTTPIPVARIRTPLSTWPLYSQRAGNTWRSYQEDIDLTRNGGGQLTNVPLPQDLWTVPLTSFSGFFAPGTVNAYNGSSQFNYAAKHNPMVFFTDTNGGNDATPANPLSTHYAPLQQLITDLANDTVADYNWITPEPIQRYAYVTQRGLQRADRRCCQYQAG